MRERKREVMKFLRSFVYLFAIHSSPNNGLFELSFAIYIYTKINTTHTHSQIDKYTHSLTQSMYYVCVCVCWFFVFIQHPNERLCSPYKFFVVRRMLEVVYVLAARCVHVFVCSIELLITKRDHFICLVCFR